MGYVSYNSNLITKITREYRNPSPMSKNIPIPLSSSNTTCLISNISLNQPTNTNTNKNKKIIIERLTKGNKPKINPQDKYNNQYNRNGHRLSTKSYITTGDNKIKEIINEEKYNVMSTTNSLIHQQKNMGKIIISQFDINTPQQSMIICHDQHSMYKNKQLQQNTKQNTNCNTEQRQTTQMFKKIISDQLQDKIYRMFTQFYLKYHVKYQTVNVTKDRKINRSLLRQLYQIQKANSMKQIKNYSSTNNNNNNSTVYNNENMNHQYSSINTNTNTNTNANAPYNMKLAYQQNKLQQTAYFYQPIPMISKSSYDNNNLGSNETLYNNYTSNNNSNQTNNNNNNNNKVYKNSVIDLNLNTNDSDQPNNYNGYKYKLNHKCYAARRVKTQSSLINKQQQSVHFNGTNTNINNINNYNDKYRSLVPIPRIKSQRIHLDSNLNEKKFGTINSQNFNSQSSLNLKTNNSNNGSNNNIKVISSSLNIRNQPIGNINLRESSVEKLRMIRQQLHDIYSNRHKNSKNGNQSEGEFSRSFLNISRTDVNLNNNINNNNSKCNDNGKENALEYYRAYLMQNRHQNNYLNHRLLIKYQESK